MSARINRAIELLEQGQPIYYTGAGERSYEGGKKAAGTWADFIMYDMEAACFDIGKIKDQMAMCRGLKIVPMVNVASQDPVMMQLPLDCGAMGLMIPVVETREQAEKIAAIFSEVIIAPDADDAAKAVLAKAVGRG